MSKIEAMVTKTKPKAVPFSHQSILLYGKPGVGKTTFSAAFENALYLDLESGALNQEINRVKADTWGEFVELVDALVVDTSTYNTLVIDTVTDLFELCRDHVLKENGWEAESDGPYGKGWAMVRSEFKQAVNKLFKLSAQEKLGVVFVAHEQVEEIEKPTKIVHMAKPLINDKVIVEFMAAKPQMILRAAVTTDKEGNQRHVLLSRGSNDTFEAKDRSKRLDRVMPLSYDKVVSVYERSTID